MGQTDKNYKYEIKLIIEKLATFKKTNTEETTKKKFEEWCTALYNEYTNLHTHYHQIELEDTEGTYNYKNTDEYTYYLFLDVLFTIILTINDITFRNNDVYLTKSPFTYNTVIEWLKPISKYKDTRWFFWIEENRFEPSIMHINEIIELMYDLTSIKYRLNWIPSEITKIID